MSSAIAGIEAARQIFWASPVLGYRRALSAREAYNRRRAVLSWAVAGR